MRFEKPSVHAPFRLTKAHKSDLLLGSGSDFTSAAGGWTFPLSNGAGVRALGGGDLRSGCWIFAISAAPILKPGGKNVLNPRMSLS